MNKKEKIILIAGSTASGKSKIAITLSKLLNGEIVNADSMQVYKEFRILTSRPEINDEKKTKHHLYGITSVKSNFSTGRWLKKATSIIKKILKKNKTPIVVGGTGLYFNALSNGLAKIPNIPIKFRNKIRSHHKKIGQVKFYLELLKLAPNVKKKINSQDTQRSIRAYEVKKFTKKSLYEWFKKTKPAFNSHLFRKLFISLDREFLISKINLRTEMMFKKGAIKEVIKFIKLKISKDKSANKIIGVSEIGDYLNKKVSIKDTKELIKIRTRQYAKRQNTWARGKMSSWEIINTSNHKELLKKVIN